ncbi:josephin-1-like isoform X1 [Argiope bruennichi]|uniref:Josephin-2 n=2 Tax=Argiope bruennichi TaxID=94029 RepID=A0A8T0EJR2_ARGBR|nr:josephin-1-like isoform X1 [Argiope bruennichi]KAF8774172.1 Josephin-1 like protein [Argiope bruennichi]
MEIVLNFLGYSVEVVFHKFIVSSFASMHNSCLHFVENWFGRDRKSLQKGGSKGNIYHEKQVKELCALHALNNLFQDKNAFNKQILDNICHSLSPDNLVNPHKSLLGLGNYDVNVLMAALQIKGYEAMWFDKRKDPSNIDFSKICGLILNIPSEMKFLPLRLNRKHWIAVKEIDGTFYNLDSKLESPVAIGKAPDLVTYLREQIRGKDREIFLVVDQNLDRNSLWKKEPRWNEPPSHNTSSNRVNSTVAVIHLNSEEDSRPEISRNIHRENTGIREHRKS